MAPCASSICITAAASRLFTASLDISYAIVQTKFESTTKQNICGVEIATKFAANAFA